MATVGIKGLSRNPQYVSIIITVVDLL